MPISPGKNMIMKSGDRFKHKHERFTVSIYSIEGKNGWSIEIYKLGDSCLNHWQIHRDVFNERYEKI